MMQFKNGKKVDFDFEVLNFQVQQYFFLLVRVRHTCEAGTHTWKATQGDLKLLDWAQLH